jgi:hypothetical protein
MDKPVVFYHFDFNRFFSNGILRERNETFLGEITHSEAGVIQSISNILENKFNQDDAVSQSKQDIIKYTDARNNERIYNSILNTTNTSPGLRVTYINTKGQVKRNLQKLVKYTTLLHLYRPLRGSLKALNSTRK